MISGIRIVNFRNYDDCGVEFADGLNCMVGANGQGKTNMLEAVYYLSLLRSFRTGNVNEMRQWKKDYFLLSGRIPSEAGPESTVSVKYGQERRLFIDGNPAYRASDFINSFICVTFIPSDLMLVQGAPSLRRRYLDISISQANPEYLRRLQAYSTALASRNAMLKNMSRYDRKTVTAYDSVLSREGAFIESRRTEFAGMLNDRLKALSADFIGDGRVFGIKYMMRMGGFMLQDRSSDLTGEAELEEAISSGLERSYERDLENGFTSIGPHRSDFSSLLGGVSMLKYASQGECRMASLALKLSCFEIIRQKRGVESVTLLVDDVIGELDDDRRRRFFDAIHGVGQTLFACTGMPPGLGVPDRVFEIRDGTCAAV